MIYLFLRFPQHGTAHSRMSESRVHLFDTDTEKTLCGQDVRWRTDKWPPSKVTADQLDRYATCKRCTNIKRIRDAAERKRVEYEAFLEYQKKQAQLDDVSDDIAGLHEWEPEE